MHGTVRRDKGVKITGEIDHLGSFWTMVYGSMSMLAKDQALVCIHKRAEQITNPGSEFLLSLYWKYNYLFKNYFT